MHCEVWVDRYPGVLREIFPGNGRHQNLRIFAHNLTAMLEDFHYLDLRERTDLILREGQHVTTTDFYGATVKLYHLKTRYIEVYHHPVTQMVMRVSFATTEDLEKHVKRIAVEF